MSRLEGINRWKDWAKLFQKQIGFFNRGKFYKTNCSSAKWGQMFHFREVPPFCRGTFGCFEAQVPPFFEKLDP
jgi:hypothetical protein